MLHLLRARHIGSLLLIAWPIVRCSAFVSCDGPAFGRIEGGASPQITSITSIMTTRMKATTQEDFESYDGGDYKVFVGRGMQRFRRCQIAGSVDDFDRAIELQPSLAPYMWQRGLSLYYADQFEEGSKQFRKDVALNPNDTEEAIWAFMCEARMPSVGFATARQRLLKISNERRTYMRAAYALFNGDSTEGDLAKQMELAPGNVNASGAPYFYANLYLGLYAEAKGDAVLARKYISAAVRSPYAKSSGDYMGDVARVHQKVRAW